MSLDFSAQKHIPSDGAKVLTMNGTIAGYQTDEDLRAYVLQSQGMPNGLATLDENGKLTDSQLPVDPEIGERLDDLTSEVTTLKRENALLKFDVKNLKEASEGNLYTEASAVYPDDTTFGDSVPSKALSGAVVNEVRGKSEPVKKNLLLNKTGSPIHSALWNHSSEAEAWVFSDSVPASDNYFYVPNEAGSAIVEGNTYTFSCDVEDPNNWLTSVNVDGWLYFVFNNPNRPIRLRKGHVSITFIATSGMVSQFARGFSIDDNINGAPTSAPVANSVKVKNLKLEESPVETPFILAESEGGIPHLVSASNVKVRSEGRNILDVSNLQTINYQTNCGVVDVEAGKKYTVSTFKGESSFDGALSIQKYDGGWSDFDSIASYNGKKTVTIPSGVTKIAINGCAQPGRYVMVEKGETSPTTYKPYRPPVVLDLSFLNSVPDIGMEGTVVDLQNKTVTWNWGKYIFTGNEGFDYISSWLNKAVRWNGASFTNALPNFKRNGKMIVVGYDYKSGGDTWSNVANAGNMVIGGITISDGIVIRNDSLASASEYLNEFMGKRMYYELATPITKTFAELGLSDIITNLPVEGNGTITVLSDGAQASAKVDYLVKTN